MLILGFKFLDMLPLMADDCFLTFSKLYHLTTDHIELWFKEFSFEFVDFKGGLLLNVRKRLLQKLNLLLQFRGIQFHAFKL